MRKVYIVDKPDFVPAWLTCLLPALMICSVHRPSAFSPQKCTLINGQSSKLELTTSRGRSKRRVEVVPIGDVRSSLKFPRGKNRSVILHWTCSRNRTSLRVPIHALTSMDTVSALPYVGSICLHTPSLGVTASYRVNRPYCT